MQLSSGRQINDQFDDQLMSLDDIGVFWRKMTEHFMPWFSRNYGLTPSSEWLSVFESITKKEARVAYRRTLEEFLQFPPTPRQFIKLAKEQKPWNGVNHQSSPPEYLLEASIKKAEDELGVKGKKCTYEEFKKMMIDMKIKR